MRLRCALARVYLQENAQGRFTSPDKPFADLSVPEEDLTVSHEGHAYESREWRHDA